MFQMFPLSVCPQMEMSLYYFILQCSEKVTKDLNNTEWIGLDLKALNMTLKSK